MFAMAHSKDVADRLRDYLQELKSRTGSAEQSGYIAWDVQEPRQGYREVKYSNGDTYQGDMLGNQRHGHGTHTSSNGDVYKGAWRLEQRHGRGHFATAAGLTYDGDWAEDRTHEQGRCTYPDGSCYEGEWHQDQRQGWGCYTTPDGQRYEGEWHHDTMHGQGEWRFADGRSYFLGQYVEGQRVQGKLVLQVDPGQPAEEYQGKFQQGKRHGQGVQVVRGAYQHSGTWQEDRRCGPGTCTYADGSVYEGEWQRDVYHGQGCFRGADGSAYEGSWVEGKQHGQGRARLSSGDRYVGSWQQGQRHGQGKCVFANGDVYIGEWAHGKQEGDGVCSYATGDKYKGTWAAGQRHGQGLMIWADGARFKGQWEEGTWVQSAAEPALCRLSGPGLARAAAGQLATFKLQAYDDKGNKRLSGGEAFSVLLVPAASNHAVGSADIHTTNSTSNSGSIDSSSTMLGSSSAPEEGKNGQQRPQEQQQQQKQQHQELGMSVACEGSVLDHGDGSYTCSYQATSAGRYMLHVLTDDGEAEHVADSPYPVLVLPGEPSFRCCTVEGPGRHQAHAGSRATFTVTVRDACGNLCDQLMPQQLEKLLPIQGQLRLNSRMLPVECRAQPKGAYTCCYTAPAAGLGVLELTVGACHLRGSPFSVKVEEPPQLAASEQESAAAATALEAPPASSSSTVPDLVTWWGRVAEQEYAAVDGDLTGFTDTEKVQEVQTAEQEYAQRHPHVPVVERLEDLWLLQKLQQDRAQQQDKVQQQDKAQQQSKTQQQAATSSAVDAQLSRPAATAAAGAAGAGGASPAVAATADEQQQEATSLAASPLAGTGRLQGVVGMPEQQRPLLLDESKHPAQQQLVEASVAAAVDIGVVDASTTEQEAAAEDDAGQTTEGALSGLPQQCMYVDLDELD